ncbi:unnamed protein product [Clonostachys rosea f. rosea IK726]|uniref:Uncharacterized protein n=1 Tax=Clonostachys rosea f. rosea IK726 TaxID=1349383 RepID=A0ACA9UTU8_BIOOC|nr:unnamed protein product [Clonostachys rosea f. rosea IK726]
MYIHPSGIRNSLKQTIFEMKYPEVTNEEPSRQYLTWIRNVILKLWKDKAGPWDWPPEEERKECVEELNTLNKLYAEL